MFRLIRRLGMVLSVPIVLAGCGDEPATLVGPDSGTGEIVDTDPGVSYSRLSDYWRGQCYKEICYALSKQRYQAGDWGTSNRISADGHWFLGDWNYMGLGRGKGGQCKGFAREIVKRATGNRYDLPTGYDYAHGNIAWCRPGDVIQRSNSYGTPHTAIVFAVLERDGAGRATKIDVIDSNFIQGNTIARHVLPMWGYQLHQFKVW